MNTSVSENTNVKKRKRKKGSGGLNIINLLLILIIVAILAALFYVFSPISALKRWSAEEATVEYTVEITGVDKNFINFIQENDLVVDAVSKGQLGTVRVADYNYQYTILQYVEKDGSPEGVLAEHPDKCNVLVTISATASYVEGEGYLINKRRVAVGEEMQLIFPGYVGQGYCIDIHAVS